MSLQQERKLTMQMQANEQKKDSQIKDLQDEIKTLITFKQATSAQMLLSKSDTQSQIDQLLQSHTAELKKLNNKISDSEIELKEL